MKRFLVTCTAAMVAFAAQAQAGKMYGGIKGGANFADISGFDNMSTRTGFQGGLFVGTHINDEFGLHVEGLYVQKGAKFDTGTTEETIELDYIEFPILFVYDLSAGASVGVNLFVGPTLGFNVTAKSEGEDVKDETESFEFGGAIGAGIAKTMASGKAIGLDVRYTLGATTVDKDDTDNPKNRGIGLMAFFQIPLGAQP